MSKSDIDRDLAVPTEPQRVDQLAALGAHMASLAHEIGGRLMGIQMLIEALEPRFVRKHITVERRVDVDLPTVLIDRDRIVQAIVNIVTNAFEATPSDGKVSVSVLHEDQATVIRAANTGSFITPRSAKRSLRSSTRPSAEAADSVCRRRGARSPITAATSS